MKNSGTIFNIQHFSLHDGAGIRTVVFLKGCPLDCIWCHNPESKISKPEILFSFDKCVGCLKCAQVCNSGCLAKADGILNINRKNCIFCGKCEEVCSFDAISLVGKSYTADEVLDELKKDDIFFGNDGGVTFSGGEPFAQPDFLLTLLKKCKEKGYTLMPLQVYFKDGRAKMEIGLCKGKKLYDKRDDIAKKDMRRETERDFKVKNLY